MWKLTQHILIWQRPCFYSRCHRMIVYEKTRFCKHLSIRVVFFFFCQGICVLDSHGWTLVVGLSWLDSHGWTLAYPTRDQNSVLCSSLLFCFFFLVTSVHFAFFKVLSMRTCLFWTLHSSVSLSTDCHLLQYPEYNLNSLWI